MDISFFLLHLPFSYFFFFFFFFFFIETSYFSFLILKCIYQNNYFIFVHKKVAKKIIYPSATYNPTKNEENLPIEPKQSLITKIDYKSSSKELQRIAFVAQFVYFHSCIYIYRMLIKKE